jgi:serine/threonine protein kinase
MENKSTLDNFIILKTLGKGYSGKVKLGKEKDTGELYALKILNLKAQDINKILKSLENECKIMKELNHKNIVKFVNVKKGVYTNSKKEDKKVIYVIIELASKGEIFEVLFNVGPFNENLARYYFKQLIEAMEYLHENNVAHRDLKPENLLLDDELNLKLADFGFATIVEGDQKNKTRLGTERYMAPELLYKKPYDAKKVDIFAMGVILFVFYAGHPPFHEALLDDPYYNTFVKKPQKFWSFHSNQGQKKQFSENFISLITNMMALNAEDRYNISQVKNSDWMKENLDSEKAKADIEKYMKALEKVVESKMKEEKIETTHAQTEYRDIELKSSMPRAKFMSLPKMNFKLKKEKIPENFKPNVVIKVNNDTDVVDIIRQSVEKLPDYKGKIIWSSDKTKFSLKFFTELDKTVQMKVKIFDLNQAFGLELIKEKGSSFDFYEIKHKFIQTLQ